MDTWHPAAGAGAGRRSGSSGRGSRGDGSRVAGVVAALLNRSLRGSGGGGLQSFLALHVALHAEVLVHLIHLRTQAARGGDSARFQCSWQHWNPCL